MTKSEEGEVSDNESGGSGGDEAEPEKLQVLKYQVYDIYTMMIHIHYQAARSYHKDSTAWKWNIVCLHV